MTKQTLGSDYTSTIQTLTQVAMDDSASNRELKDNPQTQLLICSSLKLYNFDEVTKLYQKGKIKRGFDIRSCDGLFITPRDELYLVEFKNRSLIFQDKKEEALEEMELLEKAQSSLLALSDLLQMDIRILRSKITYILVYNPNKNNGSTVLRGQTMFRGLKAKLNKVSVKAAYVYSDEDFEKNDLAKWTKWSTP